MKYEARDSGISAPLIDAAGLVADGSDFDLLSLSSSLVSEEERAIADELAVVARIAQAHRKLHQVLPQPEPGSGTVPFAASWGHLDLIEVVGRGSYGTVYRAWDPRLDRQVALKLFHGARNPEAVMHEGRMLARIRHENVVTVYGADVYNGIAGIWMEFVHGRRLDQIVEKSGPLSVEETIRAGVAVCRALEAVHGAGLLHCDVKAQNVIREQGGRIVLMDLGAGRETIAVHEEGAALQVAGTPRYMAPEVFDRGSARPQSDVYSVGVLLFYLSTGKFPVDGNTLSDIRRAHLEGRRARLTDYQPDLPVPFVETVTRALDPTPEKRHDTPGALEQGLDTCPVDVSTPAARARVQWKWIAAAASMAIAVALAGLAGWRVATSTPTAGFLPPRSLAVLPIRNLTGDPSNADLADGLTEVLISNFARMRAFSVPPSTAVASFRDTTEPTRTIAEKLGVELVLAGSLVQIGSHATMVIHVIDPGSDKVIWTNELSRELSSLVTAQGEIATLVARHLGVDLTSGEERALKQPSLDPRAQDAYLRALAASESAADLKGSAQALSELRLATEVEPSFADAWAQRALEEMRALSLTAHADRRERAKVIRDFADRALQLDPGSPRAYLALGSSLLYNDWDFDAAEKTLKAGLEQAPSSSIIMQRLATLLSARKRFDEAIALGQQAVNLERLQPARYSMLSTYYAYARRFGEAEVAARHALTLDPSFPSAHFSLARVYTARGQYADAIAYLNRALVSVDYPAYVAELARVHALAGNRDEASRLVRRLEQRRAKGEAFGGEEEAFVAAAQGRMDDAFRLLEEAIVQRSPGVLWLAVDPRADGLRSDPRFARILSTIGL